jgi:GLPGLI family protein
MKISFRLKLKTLDMKHLITFIGVLIGLAAAHVVFGQIEGSILYEMKVNVHRTLPQDRPEMKEMVPEFNIHKSKLVFKDAESVYVNVDEEEEEEFNDEGGGMRIRMRRPMNEYYFNFAKGKRVTVQEFVGKNFIIEDSTRTLPWKLAGETKTILGKECRKATWFNEERKQNVVAWYTDKLPAFLGPEIFTSLPGTVLEVDINDGERVITAKQISFDQLGKGELKIPTKGEKTTEADFRKLVEEHRKRIGGSGNIIIRN